MFSTALARRAAIALVAGSVALSACGDKKDKRKDSHDGAPAQVEPSANKERSFLARACEKHGDATQKANCLCRVDVMDATLSKELLAKLETAPQDGPTEAVVEHLGGMANLSQVYDAMRKASDECEEGGSR